MQLLLLGTAAAEGWPAAYCDCPVCELARQRGGHDFRMRSGALIDDDLKIDHSPDTVVHMQHARRSLAKVRTILFTHDHPDHIFPIELKRTLNLAADRPRPPIAVYANDIVLQKIRAAFDNPLEYRLDLQPALQPFEPVTLPDSHTTILPLPATHCPEALLFRITRNGRSIFYGHDSGPYQPETLAALGHTGPLDLALLDCTHTTRTGLDFKHHMNIPLLLQMVDELRRNGAILPTTQLIATHFAPHFGARTHEELVNLLAPHYVQAAYDGMMLQV